MDRPEQPLPEVGARLEWLELGDAWLVDPSSGREGRGSLVVEGGVLARVAWAEEVARGKGSGGAAPGMVCCPGFIDLHAHVREPGMEEAESWASGLVAAARGGFTTVLSMADTRPAVDRPEVVQRVRAAAAAAGSPVRSRPWGAVTQGREGAAIGPLASLAAAGVAGFSDDPSPLTDPAVLRAALTEAGALGLPVTVHADEPSLSGGAEANEGLPATILGLRGASSAAEVMAVGRAVAVLRQVSGEAPPDVRPHLHLAHLSSAEALDLVRGARAAGLRVTCDVTPHHLALHDGWPAGDRRWSWEAAAQPWSGQPGEAAPYDPATRVDPPLRSPEDALALLAGLADGTVDAVATDHSPWRAVDKEVPFGEAAAGISGLETCLGLVLEAVAAGRLDLPRAVRALTVGAWRVIDGERLEVPRPGLRETEPADLVLFARDERWTVDRAGWRSRGLASPLLGRALPGRVLLTVARGRVAWVDPSFG